MTIMSKLSTWTIIHHQSEHLFGYRLQQAATKMHVDLWGVRSWQWWLTAWSKFSLYRFGNRDNLFTCCFWNPKKLELLCATKHWWSSLPHHINQIKIYYLWMPCLKNKYWSITFLLHEGEALSYSTFSMTDDRYLHCSLKWFNEHLSFFC